MLWLLSLKALRYRLLSAAIRTALALSLYSFFYMRKKCSSHCFEVGEAVLKKDDVIDLHAPIRMEQERVRQNQLMVIVLFV